MPNLPRFLLRSLLGARLPKTAGDATVPGLSAPLKVHRDAWGVAYVEAQADLDAFFGLGFCHGQDRPFQLEILLRAVRGTLSEMIGEPTLPIDRLSRRIGFHRAAQEQWPVLAPEARDILAAYARGVNAGRSVGLPKPPHEMAILRSAMTPWTPEDSLGVNKLLSFTLPSNWDVEIARLRILLADGPEALAALDPAYPAWHPVTDPGVPNAGPALVRVLDEAEALLSFTGRGGGSNNWVVAGSRTATGRPILCNDPHLDSRLPAHWYLVHLRAPEWAACGASFVGGPGILAGHNGHAAWGLTAGLVDNTDLFVEQVGPDGRSVRQGEAFVPCPIREEVIRVKGRPDVRETVLITPRGPIISPALEGVPEALSLRATWLDPLPLMGLLRLHRVRSFDEFRACLAQWPAISQNMLYADVTGTIGWQLFGAAPQRRKGQGLVPLAGWDPDAGWFDEPVPYHLMPHRVDPPEGFLATANNQPEVAWNPPYLGVDWLDGYRLTRIQKLLRSRSDWDVPAMLRMQLDQVSTQWDELREFVQDLPTMDRDVIHAVEMLNAWDGDVSAGSLAAAVFELFVAHLLAEVARAKAPKSFAWVLGQGCNRLCDRSFFAFRRVGHLVRRLREERGRWDEAIAAALKEAVTTAVHRNPERRGWGHLRQLTLKHPLGRGSARLAGLFNVGPVPCGGDADTINQAAVQPLEPLLDCTTIPSLRMVIDVGGWENSRWVLPGGQSGNPLSPHYADQFPLWQRGEAIPIAWSPEAVRRATVTTLTLTPAGGAV